MEETRTHTTIWWSGNPALQIKYVHGQIGRTTQRKGEQKKNSHTRGHLQLPGRWPFSCTFLPYSSVLPHTLPEWQMEDEYLKHIKRYIVDTYAHSHVSFYQVYLPSFCIIKSRPLKHTDNSILLAVIFLLYNFLPLPSGYGVLSN